MTKAENVIKWSVTEGNFMCGPFVICQHLVTKTKKQKSPRKGGKRFHFEIQQPEARKMTNSWERITYNGMCLLRNSCKELHGTATPTD